MLLKLHRSYFTVLKANINLNQLNLNLEKFFFQSTLAILDKLDLDTDKPSEEEIARKFGFEDEYLTDRLTWWMQTKPKIWSLFDEPNSSWVAKVSTFQYNFSPKAHFNRKF